MKGIDYSFGKPGGAVIKAAGYDFVIRYVDYPGASGKQLTKEELKDLQANDVAVGLVFESTSNRALGSNAAGETDARYVRNFLTSMNWPENLPVYFAVDFEATPAQLPVIHEYLKGAATILGGVSRVGVYGSYAVVSACYEAKTASYFWQCLAWSYGKLFEHRHVYQSAFNLELNGVGIDENDSSQDDFGQWTVTKGDDMSAEDKQAIRNLQKITSDQAELIERLSFAVMSGAEESTHTLAQRRADTKYRIAQCVDQNPPGGPMQSVGCRAQVALNIIHDRASTEGMTTDQIDSMIDAAFDRAAKAAIGG